MRQSCHSGRVGTREGCRDCSSDPGKVCVECPTRPDPGKIVVTLMKRPLCLVSERTSPAIKRSSTMFCVPLRLYVRQQGESLEMQNRCAEIKIRAERKAGQMLGETVQHQGGRPEKPSHDGRVSTPQLKELGITWNDSSRWQSIASIPEEEFERIMRQHGRAGRNIYSTASSDMR